MKHALLLLVTVASACSGADAPEEPVVADSGAVVDSTSDDAPAETDSALVDSATPDTTLADVAPEAAAPLTYRNVVLDENGDPACARFGDTYYLYLPEQVRKDGNPVGGRVLGFTSKNLVTWTSVGEVFNNVNMEYGGQRTVGLWAPEVFAHGGKFYLYYASLMAPALDADVGDKDIVVIESDSPTSFIGGKRTVLLDDQYSFIDPTVFADPGDGRLYLYYKRRGMKGTGSELQVRPLATPTSFSGPAKMLVDSETIPNSDHTVEQPTAWREGSLYYLLFSAGHGGGTNYRIPYATATSPLGPFTQRGVVFRSDADLTGDVSKTVISPGASSIVRDGAGKPWMVYRQKKTTADTFADRGVCIDPIRIEPATKTMTGDPTKGVVRPGPTPLP